MRFWKIGQPPPAPYYDGQQFRVVGSDLAYSLPDVTQVVGRYYTMHWKPSQDELSAIANGGAIEIRIEADRSIVPMIGVEPKAAED